MLPYKHVVRNSGMNLACKKLQTCIDNGIEGIVAIGGDGSFRGAADLSAEVFPALVFLAQLIMI